MWLAILQRGSRTNWFDYLFRGLGACELGLAGAVESFC
jgi:hypothetical protein